jgi:hypothetical protein
MDGSWLHFSPRNETCILSAASVCPVLSCRSRANLRRSSSCTLRSRWESFYSSAVRSEITDSSWARESANRLECGVNVHISPPGNSGIDQPYLAGISVFCHSALQGI